MSKYQHIVSGFCHSIVQCRCNEVNFLPTPHNRHLTARAHRRETGWLLLWVQIVIYVLPVLFGPHYNDTRMPIPDLEILIIFVTQYYWTDRSMYNNNVAAGQQCVAQYICLLAVRIASQSGSCEQNAQENEIIIVHSMWKLSHRYAAKAETET